MAFRTERDLDRLTLPAGKPEVFHFDAKCPGLSVRIQRTGKPAFVVWYTAANGKRKRLTLGAVAGIALDDRDGTPGARRQATEIINAARDGRDPGMERKRAREAAATALSVGDLIKAYLRDRAERRHRSRTLVETKRALNTHFKLLHGRPASDVTRLDVSARLIDLAGTTGPVGANRARAALSAAFAWAIKAGLADHNPVVGTVKNEETARDRVLAPAELAAIWRATGSLHSYDAIVRLLMLTWARRLEVGGMVRAELDLDGALWSLPGERTKNGLPLEVPLSRQALAILAASPVPVDKQGQPKPDCPYLFGRHRRSPFSGWSQCKARLDERIARQRAEQRLGRELRKGEQPEPGDQLERWTLHDLRRSGVTHAAEQAIAAPHIIEAVVNHVSGHKGGVAGVYNRAVYRAEKAAALQRWADWLEAKVEGREPASNVKPMQRAG